MPKLPGASDLVESVFSSFKKGTIKKADYETFNKTYDPVMDNRQEAMDALRESAQRQKYLAARGAAQFDELSLKMDDQEKGNTFMSNLISPAFKADSSEINIDMRKMSLNNLTRAGLGDLEEALSTRLSKGLGFDEEAQKQFIRAVVDPEAPVEPKYRSMAQAWEKANKLALEQHTAAGGDIGEIVGTGGYLPQTHDTLRMMEVKAGGSKAKNKASRLIEDAQVAKDEWINFTKKTIDYDKMNLKGKSAKEITEILSEIYETITSGGLNKVKKAMAERKNILEVYEKMVKDGRTDAAAKYKEQFQIKDGESVADFYQDFKVEPMTANQRAKHREIHYTAKGWEVYQQRYGQRDIYNTISDYLDGMAMDTAAMQVLGPNPTKTWAKLKEKAKIEGKLSGIDEHLQGMFDVATGKTDRSISNSDVEQFLESAFGTYRSLGVASDLGGAAISSLTDPIFAAATYAHAGMNPLKAFTTEISTIGKRIAAGANVSEKEKMAKRLGIVMDSYMSSIRNNRFSEGGGHAGTQKVAEGVLRASGLMALTNIRRTTFGLEMNSHLADHVGKKLNSFTFGKQLEDTYGITQADWAKIKKTDLTPDAEGGYLNTAELYMREPDLALRIMDIVNQETQYAVPMPDSRVRSIVTGGGAEKGTLKGELARTVWMYKSFPITIMTSHVGRMLGMKTLKGKLAYGGGLVAFTSIMGVGVIQMKEALKGRETVQPRDAGEWSALMLRGTLQGGGLGLFGDLIFGDATRYGGGMVSTVVGKAGQPLEDIDTIKKLIQGDNVEVSDILSDIARLGSNYVPGRNLWYTRLLYERAFKDQLMKAVDPDYNKKLRKHLRKLDKDTGQGYWSTPGEIPGVN